ncbi:MAG: hypothetical protein RIC37_06465 [Gammaproteobacteria bacterium]
MKAALKMHFFRDSFVSSVLESSCILSYTAVLGFGFLRRSISCIHAVVRAGFLALTKKLLFSEAPLGTVT